MKKETFAHLLTKEGEGLCDPVWDAYPRPQLRRETWLNLNGEWDFAVTAGEEIPQAFCGFFLTRGT